MTNEVKTGIDGDGRTLRELLKGAKYTIDFYQREYAWQERHVHELVDDLTSKFLGSYEPGHARHEVEQYGHYFLGSVVISQKRGQRYVVDGQQRLTTLTLLLIHLHHLQKGSPSRVDVSELIYSEKFGRKSFNLDVPERAEVMQRLLDGHMVAANGESESVRNIAARYQDIVEHFPAEVSGEALPFFIDWVMENVHLVEIRAYSDDDAYTIFETMNDRGLSLSFPEMLKGYVLANISHEADQRAINALWKAKMQALKGLGDEEDVDFFKNWLRARHADTIRPGKRGAENRDYEKIGSEFHRWVRDQKDRLGLADSDAFVRFVRRDLDFYAAKNMEIRHGAVSLTSGLESIRFNQDRGFTLQTQLLLAPLTPEDDEATARLKIALVADFVDIWLARRIWNFRTISYSSVRYTIFTITKELRGKTVPELRTYLRQQLEEHAESFADEPKFRLHHQNYHQVRHILARLTHWVDTECGAPSHFEDLISQGRGRPFEIEHIWADQYDRFAKWFSHPNDFDTERNRLGGLVLLQRGINQSLNDSPFEDKRNAYAAHSHNLLARSLSPLAYENNPAFAQFIKRTGLPFRPYEAFGPEEQAQRQELCIRLAEWVWNPSRLDADGIKPPSHDPISVPDEEVVETAATTARDQARRAFWETLLPHAKTVSDLHANISAGRFHWAGARRHGQWWNYVVLQDATRAELYIDAPEPETNKALFDRLHHESTAIEVAFGGPLKWERLPAKRASRISATVEGGWADKATWQRAAEQAAQAMKRLYAALGPRVEAARAEEQE